MPGVPLFLYTNGNQLGIRQKTDLSAGAEFDPAEPACRGQNHVGDAAAFQYGQSRTSGGPGRFAIVRTAHDAAGRTDNKCINDVAAVIITFFQVAPEFAGRFRSVDRHQLRDKTRFSDGKFHAGRQLCVQFSREGYVTSFLTVKTAFFVRVIVVFAYCHVW